MVKGKKSETKSADVSKKKIRKRAPARKKTPPAPIEMTSEERWRMIAVAAYHKAEKRGFLPGKESDDWIEAEHEIDALLGRP